MEIFRNFIVMVSTIVGCFVGWEIAPAYSWMEANIYSVVFLFGATFWLLSSILTRYFMETFVKYFRRNPPVVILRSFAVVVLSAIVGYLFFMPVSGWLKNIAGEYSDVEWFQKSLEILALFLPFLGAVFIGWVGFVLFKEGISNLWEVVPPKVVDTSALLSKKFEVLLSFKVLEGKIVLLNTVLRELALLSELPSKRKAVLNALKIIKDMDVIEVDPLNYTKSDEVDVQLIEVAKALEGRVVTADRAVAGMARSLKVDVIDLTELNITEDLKVGDVVEVIPVKRGREKDQYVAYTEFGNMVVIPFKRDILEKRVRVKITNVTPTEVGKVYFAVLVEVLGGEGDEGKGGNENHSF